MAEHRDTRPNQQRTQQQGQQQRPPAQQQKQQQRAEDPLKARFDLVKKLCERTRDAVLPKLLGKNGDADRWLRVFLNAFERNTDLLACTTGSICRALMHSAEVQLEVGGAFPHAYLVPYEYNRGTATAYTELQLMISVWGYTELVRRSGVRKVWADVVCEADTYECISGTEGKRIVHTPDWFRTRVERGDVLGSYACAILANGETVFEPVSREELDAAKAANRGKSPAWTQWPEQMMQKVALKRLAKYLPKGYMPERALQIDEDPQTKPFIDVPGIPSDDELPFRPVNTADDVLNQAVAAGRAQAAAAAAGPASANSNASRVVDRDRLHQRLCDADERWLNLRAKVDSWTEAESLEVLSFLRVVLDGDGFEPGAVVPEQPACMRVEDAA